MRALSEFEKHIAKIAKMDQVFQPLAEIVKRIESAAVLGRQLHETANVPAPERAFQDSAVAQSLAWAKNAAFTEEMFRSAAATERSMVHSSMIFHAEDRIRTKLPLEAFLQSERSLGEAMMEIEKRRALIEEVARRAEAAQGIPHKLRAFRNAAVHQQELVVEDDANHPLSMPLVVDAEKNLEAIERGRADQQDFMEYRLEAESEPRNSASRLARSPGTRMMGIAEAVFSVQDVELVFEPLVGDYRMEMNEAVHAGNVAKQYALRAEYRKRFVYSVVQVAWAIFARVFQAIRGS